MIVAASWSGGHHSPHQAMVCGCGSGSGSIVGVVVGEGYYQIFNKLWLKWHLSNSMYVIKDKTKDERTNFIPVETSWYDLEPFMLQYYCYVYIYI